MINCITNKQLQFILEILQQNDILENNVTSEMVFKMLEPYKKTTTNQEILSGGQELEIPSESQEQKQEVLLGGQELEVPSDRQELEQDTSSEKQEQDTSSEKQEQDTSSEKQEQDTSSEKQEQGTSSEKQEQDTSSDKHHLKTEIPLEKQEIKTEITSEKHELKKETPLEKQDNDDFKSLNLRQVVNSQCKARLFGPNGWGGQCKQKFKDGSEFCGRHATCKISKKYSDGPNKSCRECSKAQGKLIIHTSAWEHFGRYIPGQVTEGPKWKCYPVNITNKSPEKTRDFDMDTDSDNDNDNVNDDENDNDNDNDNDNVNDDENDNDSSLSWATGGMFNRKEYMDMVGWVKESCKAYIIIPETGGQGKEIGILDPITRIITCH